MYRNAVCTCFEKRWFVETPASFLKQNKQRIIFGSFDNARCKCDTLSQKRTLLEAFVAITSYVLKYARWLLNHAKEVQQMDGHSYLRRYGPEVQHALFLVWNAANRICAKRLIPFLLP